MAIPEYQGHVSPAFDSCRRLLIVDKETGGPQQIVPLDWSSLPRGARATRLKHLDVEVLICGGISIWLAERVEIEGIRVISWVSGEVQQVLEAYLAGSPTDFQLPTSGRCGRKPQAQGPNRKDEVSARKETEGDGKKDTSQR